MFPISSLNRQWIKGTRFLLLPKNPSVNKGKEGEERDTHVREKNRGIFARREERREIGNLDPNLMSFLSPMWSYGRFTLSTH